MIYKILARDINLTNLPILPSVLPGDTSDSRNSSLYLTLMRDSYIPYQIKEDEEKNYVQAKVMLLCSAAYQI